MLKCIDLSCMVIFIIKDSSLGGALLLADKAFWKGHLHGAPACCSAQHGCMTQLTTRPSKHRTTVIKKWPVWLPL